MRKFYLKEAILEMVKILQTELQGKKNRNHLLSVYSFVNAKAGLDISYRL